MQMKSACENTHKHTRSPSLAPIRELLAGVWGGGGVKGESVLMADVGGLFCSADRHCHVHAHVHTRSLRPSAASVNLPL